MSASAVFHVEQVLTPGRHTHVGDISRDPKSVKTDRAPWPVLMLVPFLFCGCLAILLAAGITGPPKTEFLINATNVCRDDAVVRGSLDLNRCSSDTFVGAGNATQHTYISTLSDLNLLNRYFHLDLSLGLDEELSRETQRTFVATVVVEGRRVRTLEWEMVFSPFNQTVSTYCVTTPPKKSATCEGFILLDVNILKYFEYRSRVKILPVYAAAHVESVHVRYAFGDYNFALTELLMRYIFAGLTLAFGMEFSLYTWRYLKWEHWHLEQKLVCVLFVATLMYDNPIAVLKYTVSSEYLEMAMKLFERTFAAIWMLVVLCFADLNFVYQKGGRRESHPLAPRLYGKHDLSWLSLPDTTLSRFLSIKLLLVTVYWGCGLGYFVHVAYLQSKNPTYTGEQDSWIHIVYLVFQYGILITWIIMMCFFCTRGLRHYRNDMKQALPPPIPGAVMGGYRRHYGKRYFLLISTSVIPVLWMILNQTFDDGLTPLSQASDSTFLPSFGIFHLHVYILAFAYTPSTGELWQMERVEEQWREMQDSMVQKLELEEIGEEIASNSTPSKTPVKKGRAANVERTRKKVEQYDGQFAPLKLEPLLDNDAMSPASTSTKHPQLFPQQASQPAEIELRRMSGLAATRDEAFLSVAKRKSEPAATPVQPRDGGDAPSSGLDLGASALVFDEQEFQRQMSATSGNII